MTREEIGQFLARRQASWKLRDIDRLVADHAEEGVVETPFAGGTVKGRAAIEKLYRGFLSGFPDLAFERTEHLIDGDRVAQISTVTGTNKGGFMDLPPTGKKVRVPLVAIFTLKDGLIVEERRIYDFTGMLMQAGVLKARPT
jgi:steroid delta-isomerase-like uncharacterized protein